MASGELIPVRVCVRCRPFNSREKSENAAQCVQFFVEQNQVSCNGKMFTFDSVMDATTDQSTSYEVTVSSLLEKFVKGFNCTILAYGQTGSGKTYTMGTEDTTTTYLSDSRGIVPRLVDDLFKFIREQEGKDQYKVAVSMLEIYDDKIFDLLSTNAKEKEVLHAREVNGVVTVTGLTINTVGDLKGTMEQLEIGCQQRSKGETAMNAASSRSHAIFRIDLVKTSADEESDSSFSAKLQLVDLAGSERLKKTQAEGNRMKEGIRINEGLLALGNVISALAEGAGSSRHIPYRDSKITRLLQDSLGGNSYTCMIACISPADTNAEETLSTLRYADRAKRIKNKPIVVVDSDRLVIKQLRDQNLRLERELYELKNGIVSGSRVDDDAVDNSVEVMKLRQQLQDKDKDLATFEQKSREAVLYQLNMTRQLVRLEEDKEKIATIIAAADHAEETLTGLVQKISAVLEHHTENDSQDENMSSMQEESMAAQDATLESNKCPDSPRLLEFSKKKLAEVQEKLDEDLRNIMDELNKREQAFRLNSLDQENLQKLIKEHEAETASLQQKIEALMEEKKKMEQELKKYNTGNKLAEERRRKLAEMEKQLQQYTKKMNEFNKIAAQKKTCEENMKKMQKEITDLKTLRVKTIKQLRQETAQYQKCSSQYQKQIAQMKMKEKKREDEMAREKRMKDQQMIVLKQRLQESKNLSKKMETMRKKTTAKVDFTKLDDNKYTKQYRKFLNDELDIIGRARQATSLGNSLKENRASIVKKLEALKAKKDRLNDEEPSAKKPREGECNETFVKVVTEDEQLDKEIKQLEEQRELCTLELESLQRNCTHVDDNKLFDSITHLHTLENAYSALRVVLEAVVEERKSYIDLTEKVAALEEEKKTFKDEIKRLESEHRLKLREFREQLEQTESELRTQYSNILQTVCNNVKFTPEEMQTMGDDVYKSFDNLNNLLSAAEPKRSSRRHRDSEMFPENLSGPRHIAGIERFGRVVNTMKVVEAEENDESMVSSVQDSTFVLSKQTKTRTKKRTQILDISPIRPDQEDVPAKRVSRGQEEPNNEGSPKLRPLKASIQSNRLFPKP